MAARFGDASHTRCADPTVIDRCLAAVVNWPLAPELIVVHGTGTIAGDQPESAGLDDGPWSKLCSRALQAVIGHCFGASGLVELAAAWSARTEVIGSSASASVDIVAAIACQRGVNSRSIMIKHA